MPTPKSQVIAFPLGLKEAVFGTAIASASLITWIPANAVDFPELTINYSDDADEINGFYGATSREIESRMGKKSWKFNASVESLAWASAMQLGRITMAGVGDPWTGTVLARALCTNNPTSFTYFHGLNCAGFTGTFKTRKGAVINQQTIEIPGKTQIKQTVELMDDGSITDDASFTVPSKATVQKVLGGHATISLGPPGSLVDLSAAKTIRSTKIGINSNIQEIEVPGTSVNVQEYQFGEDGPTFDVDLTVKGDESSAIFGYFTSKTLVQFVCNIDAGVSPLRSWKYTMTNCHVIGCKVVPAGNETRLEVKLGQLHTTTDSGPAQIVFKTGQATFLVGA